jgi:hypothetical protein
MNMTVESLRAIVNNEGISQECRDTRDAVFQSCLPFRESGTFSQPTTYNEIGAFLGMEPKTVETH